MSHSLIRIPVLLFTVFLAIGISHAEKNELEAQEVLDLRYGETLFNFYQKKYFSAITNLMVAEVRDPIRIQGEDPHLLLGGLYLAYGMHQEASNLFQGLLSSDNLPATHDRAWYYIGKLRYLKGFLPEAEQALLKIKQTLPEEREAERLHLLANVFMSQQKYDDAIKVLSKFSGNSEWEAYANFNLGVALVKAGQLEKGTGLLAEVGALNPFKINHELNALRDKANLALGFAYMRATNPAEAIKHFKNVRLTGPLSNKALLGLGWAKTNLEAYKEALTPWFELQNRKALDTSVQESLLAIPFTIEKLNKRRLAIQHYEKAIESYAEEINRLEDVMLAVQRGELIQAMRPANLDDETSLPIHSFGLPDSITAPYLHQMMASNTFQEAYRNYQSLLHLKYILQHWSTQLPSYELMLSERRKAYYKRLPEVANDKRLKQISRMQQQRDKYARKLARIEKEEDGYGLVTDEEKEQLLILKKVKQKLARLSQSQDMSEEQNSFRLLNGILYFKLQSEFKPRLWGTKKSLKELDRTLQKTKQAKRSLVKAANAAPRFFEGYGQKITWSKQRIQNLLSRLGAAIGYQERHIQQLALTSLTKRRRHLENYHIRARFGIARLFDSLVIKKDKEADNAGQ